MVLLTDDRQIDARALLNACGDHWGQQFGHRIGKYDLYLDILPSGYILRTRRDDQGQLHREVEYEQTALFLSAWLRCLVFNLKSRFAQAMGGEYTKSPRMNRFIPWQSLKSGGDFLEMGSADVAL